jgi:hypothetical protein
LVFSDMHIDPTVAIALATTGVFAGLAFLADRKGRWIVAAFLSGAAWLSAGVTALIWMWGR